MKTIQISDDIYAYLLRHVSYIGEDASSILRRLLEIDSANLARSSVTSVDPGQPSATSQRTPAALETSPQGRVGELLNDPRVRLERDAVQKFLHILAWLAREHPSDFEGVTQISGRRRLYFSKSREALEQSGNSVHPQAIPGTEYWVITNNDTPKKRRMLEDVLQMLRYPPGDRNLILSSLE